VVAFYLNFWVHSLLSELDEWDQPCAWSWRVALVSLSGATAIQAGPLHRILHTLPRVMSSSWSLPEPHSTHDRTTTQTFAQLAMARPTHGARGRRHKSQRKATWLSFGVVALAVVSGAAAVQAGGAMDVGERDTGADEQVLPVRTQYTQNRVSCSSYEDGPGSSPTSSISRFDSDPGLH